jgi:ubiquitin-large subunit ribosomal protein L40e
VRIDNPVASPGSKVDALWHNVLLDTALCEQIYDVLNNGIVIHHSPQDEMLISDHEKMVRRLCTMSEMLWKGIDPYVDFWTEEGTVMSDIKVCEIDDIVLYVTDSTTFADITRIINMAPSANFPERGYFVRSLPKTKKRRTTGEDAGEYISVNIRWVTIKTFVLNVSRSIKVEDLKSKIQDAEGIPPHQMRLRFSGVCLVDNAKLEECGIQDNSTIDMMLRLKGC